MKVDRQELEAAALNVGISPEQSRALWYQLSQRADAEGHFEPAHVGYYFGALLVIGAMGWFITNGWDSFKGWQLASIGAGYALIFVLVARPLWQQPLFKVPAGLLVTIAVCMTPITFYGLERQFGLWPASDPGSYVRFHPWINGSWIVMELATVTASLLALRFFKFPFLTAPAAYALWYMSMDATEFLLGKSWQWREECMISAMFGAVMLLVSYWFDGKTQLDFSFWGYLFGLFTFTGGLSALDSGNQLAKFAYFLVHLGFIFVSLLLRRKVIRRFRLLMQRGVHVL